LRILLHSIFYKPDLVGMAKYNGEMAEWLAARGHEVRVVTALPFYPVWQVTEGYSAWRYQREHIAGVEAWHCPLWVPAKPSGIKRLLHLASFALSSFPVMLRQVLWRPEVVIVTEPPLFCLPGAWLVARLSGAKTWLHILDFEADIAPRLKMLGWKGPVQRLIYGTESFLMRRVDLVSTISEKMRQRVLEKGISDDRSQLFPIWAETDFVRPLERDNEVRQNLGVRRDEVLVLHAGSMGEKQGLELVLDTAELLRKREEIRFVMVGDGAARERLERAARERGLDNVRFFPTQPLEHLPLMLAAGDIHLVVLQQAVADLMMPSKLTNILAAGRPSVATVDPGTAVYEVLNGHDCGITVLPDNASELASAIVMLAQDAKMRERLGRNARQYAESYLKKEKILSNFERRLLNLLRATDSGA
jgi:colanic acid biosynthesis glycosyl transferase WcaI